MMPQCGKGHAHPSVADVRACYGLGSGARVAPAPVPAPSAVTGRTDRHVVFTESEPTPRQVSTIQHLGGVLPSGCTRGQASSIIGQLYAKRDADKKGTSVSTPTPARTPSAVEPQYLGHYSRVFPFAAPLIYALVTGERDQARYAVSKSGGETDDLVFLRVSLIKPYKSGKRRGFQGWLPRLRDRGPARCSRTLRARQGAVLRVRQDPDRRALAVVRHRAGLRDAVRGDHPRVRRGSWPVRPVRDPRGCQLMGTVTARERALEVMQS